MKHTKHFIFFLAATKFSAVIFFVAVTLGGCIKPANEEPELRSALSVVNATIGGPPVNFYISKQKVEGPALTYTQESGYFITYPGARDFDVANQGTGDYLLRTNLTFIENTYHTVFIAGEASNVSAFFTTDDLSNPPSGKAKVRFANLSPDGGALVVARKNGADLFSPQDFKTASGFITMDPGTFVVELKTAAGTVLAEREVEVVAGRIYTLWSRGMRSGVANSPIGLQFRSIN